MGKLQVFHETRYGFKATLRYLGPDAWPEEYRLIIYGFGGKEFYRRDYCTAAEAKEVLCCYSTRAPRASKILPSRTM